MSSHRIAFDPYNTSNNVMMHNIINNSFVYNNKIKSTEKDLILTP